MNDLYFVKYGNYEKEGGGDLIDFHTYTGRDIYVYSDSFTYLDYEELHRDIDYFFNYYNNEILKISNFIKEELYLAIHNNENIFMFDDIAKLRLFIKSRERLLLLDSEYVKSISEYATNALNSISQYTNIMLNSDKTISIEFSSKDIKTGYSKDEFEEYTFGYIRKKDLESLKSILNSPDDLFEYEVNSDEFNQYKNIIISNLYYNKNDYYYDSLYPSKDIFIENNWDDISRFIDDLKHLYVLNLQSKDIKEFIENKEEFVENKESYELKENEDFNSQYAFDPIYNDDIPF